MDALNRFQDLLRDLFQFDMAELDFGLYRLLRLKRDEIEAFITEQLPRQVDDAFSDAADEESTDLQTQVEELADQIRENVADDAVSADYRIKDDYKDSEVKIVRELVNKFETTYERLQSVQAVETDKAEIFNHLYSFFSRYYEDGDFIPKRRYGAREAYAVPYDGSEVFFHWANRDQHYVKTGEIFKDYAFTIIGDLVSGGDWRVRFVITEATVPKDNVKGDRRFFFPVPNDVKYDASIRECRIPFEYRPPTPEEIKEFRKTDKAKLPDQRRILKNLIPEIVEKITDDNLKAEVIVDQRTQEEVEADKPALPLLLQRMLHYTQRNTTDYFIHKNLRRFLIDEFQFYIKDQVLHIEDLEGDFEARRRMIRILRRLGEQVIEFLSQVEDAQKRLFEKKKFVLETSYLIPVQYIPRYFWKDILNNTEQIDQWRDWFALQPKKNLFNQSGEINEKFLKGYPTLVINTDHFGSEWTRRLLEALPFSNIDDAIDGLLINGENYQAIQILLGSYREQVKCIYLDPPYNTNTSQIIYKNGYKHSSWVSLIKNRLFDAKKILSAKGILCITIDDFESHRLRFILESSFNANNVLGCVAIRSNPSGRATPKGFSIAHEYAFFVSNGENAQIGRLERTAEQIARYNETDEIGQFEWVNFRKHGGANSARSARPKLFYPIYASKGKVRIPNMIWNEEKNCWEPNEECTAEEIIVYPINAKGEEKTWKLGVDTAMRKITDLCSRLDQNKKIGVYRKSRLATTGTLPRTWWDKKAYSATEYGTNLLERILGKSDMFSFPKSVHAVKDCLKVCGLKDKETAMDFFAGSGTTGHAVIDLNRFDGHQRKFIMVEMDDYFDTVLLPRISKIMYSPEWKDGKPKRPATAEEARRTPRIVKVLRLESYEDALHNLASPSTQERAKAREKAYKDVTGEDKYRLQYLMKLPLETSETMLDLKSLEHPFNYMLEVLTEGGPKRKPVDLIETFNYLYGLRVRRLETWRNDQDKIKVASSGKKQPREYRIIKATDREQKRRVLVVWRDTTALSPQTERNFLEAKVKEMAQTGEVFDEQFINADTAAERFASLDPLFKRLMMAGEEEPL